MRHKGLKLIDVAKPIPLPAALPSWKPRAPLPDTMIMELGSRACGDLIAENSSPAILHGVLSRRAEMAYSAIGMVGRFCMIREGLSDPNGEDTLYFVDGVTRRGDMIDIRQLDANFDRTEKSWYVAPDSVETW